MLKTFAYHGEMHRTLLFLILSSPIHAEALHVASLEKELASITKGFNGRVGACVQDEKVSACTKGEQRFSMQSVVKLLVGVAVLEAVDHKGWKLDGQVTVHKSDLSVYVQPIADRVGPNGFKTTIGDLVRGAIIQSDSAATDILIARLGGAAAIQESLKRRGVAGIRVDRDERHLQSEIVGLAWQKEYVDPAVFRKAIDAVPAEQRALAYKEYQGDARDTATPRGMAGFLTLLRSGKLLSGTSTAFIIQAMEECATFPDRIKAGAAPGWKVAHKTGTSGSWMGITAATNDVGILTAPSGSQLSVVVFVADSKATPEERAAIMARITATAIKHFR